MDEIPGLVQLARLAPAARADLLSDLPADLRAGPPDPLQEVTHLRRKRPDLSPDLVSAVIAQRTLQVRGRAVGSLPPGGPWLTTSVGLEQASRPEVAEHRARTIAQAGIASVVDTTAGIGMDSRAFLAAGLDVWAIEHDPVTAEVCQANLEYAAAKSGQRVHVERADSTDESLLDTAIDALPAPVAVFVDPARRGRARPVDGGRAPAERDRTLWSPPWSFVEGLRDRFEYVLVKVPPGFEPDARWKAEWVAVGSAPVECALYSPRASQGADRRVTVLDPHETRTLDFSADAPMPHAGGLRGFLAEVHPIARKNGVIARICNQVERLAPVTDSTMWLSCDGHDGAGESAIGTVGPWLRWFEKLDSGSLAEVPDICRRHSIDAIALKTAESRRPQVEIRRRIGIPDGDDFALVVIAGLREVAVVRRIRPR